MASKRAKISSQKNKTTLLQALLRPQQIVLLVVIFVVVGVLIITRTQSVPPPTLEDFESQGRTHIALGDSHPVYNSNPPTSGWHYAEPADWGIYDKALPDEQLVHNLEHGGIWISYRDSSDQNIIQQLKDIAKQYPRLLIMTYRPSDDRAIAVAAWQHLLKMDAVDKDKILTFISQYINRGPEQVE